MQIRGWNKPKYYATRPGPAEKDKSAPSKGKIEKEVEKRKEKEKKSRKDFPREIVTQWSANCHKKRENAETENTEREGEREI